MTGSAAYRRVTRREKNGFSQESGGFSADPSLGTSDSAARTPDSRGITGESRVLEVCPVPARPLTVRLPNGTLD